jgi:hypothetical protein
MAGRYRTIILIFTVFSAGFFLAACDGDLRLPQEARQALAAYWDSLPSDAGITHTITRAWPGVSAENPDLEIWCVEAEMSAPGNPAVDGERMIWIVLRNKAERSWSAALLATMSSMWPYEACGQD